MDLEDLDQYDDIFAQHFNDLQTIISNLAACDDSEKEMIITKGDNLIDDIKNEINTYTAEIEIQDYSDAKVYRENCKLHEAKLDELISQFENQKNIARNINEEVAKMNEITDEEIEARAIKMGDKLYEKSKQKASSILAIIGESNEMVKDINAEIKAQNQKLLDMEDIIKDSQSNLKRATELVDFFGNTFLKDIIMKIVICIIAIAIIVVLVLFFIGEGKDEKPSDGTQNEVIHAADTGDSVKINCNSQAAADGSLITNSVNGSQCPEAMATDINTSLNTGIEVPDINGSNSSTPSNNSSSTPADNSTNTSRFLKKYYSVIKLNNKKV